ncbi:hypothetical protein BV22DRAFT_1131288 [Leucogyrophana mollusca]|uniref:Uncharacterized protein n=1 Tax=Leucogyrophana mollusca TaxID=85980 RepID=A0ACB8BCS6_9AGAM|nr:hypothetical protein BV22DRAFT_1131288 [Leucogyrophana mollusca]
MDPTQPDPLSPQDEIVTARDPFDHPDADIILRSSDGVDFRTFKIILSLSSPVFRDMFSVPQPPHAQDSTSAPPAVLVSEDSKTLRALLLHCHPCSACFHANFDNLNDIVALLEAALKYDMSTALEHIRLRLSSSPFEHNEALSFYAISCHNGWRVEAEIAAGRVLEMGTFWRPPIGYVPEMEAITAGAYYRLLTYHHRCGHAAESVGERSLLLGADEKLVAQLSHCPSNTGACYTDTMRRKAWLDDYLTASGKELLVRPCSSTILKDTKLCQEAIAKAGCPHCRVVASAAMEQLRGLYAAQVKKVVSEVKLEFKA